MSNANQYATAFVSNVDLPDAIRKAHESISESLGGSADLTLAFMAGYESAELDAALIQMKQSLDTKVLLGSNCHALIEGSREYEATRGLVLWSASMPDTELVPIELKFERNSEGAAITGWPDELATEWPEDSQLIALAEPFSFPMDVLLDRFNEDRPGVVVSGGMASGYHRPSDGRLVLDEKVMNAGAVAVRLTGGPKIETIVSQGCRPIGSPFVITDCERNLITGLGGKSPLEQLKQLFAELPARDQREVNRGLLLGRAINEYQDKFGYGDFLIRNVMQIDPDSGFISVGDYMRKGQTVQFHIRDSDSASAELEQLMDKRTIAEPKSALVFSCNGRGLNMFPDPDHDSQRVSRCVGGGPVAGFFAGGEIGPIGGKNFVHGFSASVVLFS